MTMPDGTRCDILTDTHAIEVDFADKWAEAISSIRNYAMQTGKKAGIVLVLKDRGNEQHLERLKKMARNYSMDIKNLPHRALRTALEDGIEPFIQFTKVDRVTNKFIPRKKVALGV